LIVPKAEVDGFSEIVVALKGSDCFGRHRAALKLKTFAPTPDLGAISNRNLLRKDTVLLPRVDERIRRLLAQSAERATITDFLVRGIGAWIRDILRNV
jgi:hypothetical protein